MRIFFAFMIKSIHHKIKHYLEKVDGATSAIIAFSLVMSVPLILGSVDAMNWSLAYARLSATAQTACDRMVLTPRNYPHTFRDEDRQAMAFSAIDLEVFNRYPNTRRNVTFERSGNEAVGGITRAEVSLLLDVEAWVLPVIGVQSLPVTIVKNCQGIPPFPVLGGFLVNDDFNNFSPAVSRFLSTRGSQGGSQNFFEEYIVDDIQDFGWMTTKNTTDSCGLRFMPVSNMPDGQSNNPPPGGSEWAVSLRANCGREWAARPIEFHPGFYEIYMETQTTSENPSNNYMSLWINNIYNDTALQFTNTESWRLVTRIGGGQRLPAQAAPWDVWRGVVAVRSYEPVMMMLWPDLFDTSSNFDDGLSFSNFRIRYLGTDFDPNDQSKSINRGRDFYVDIN